MEIVENTVVTIDYTLRDTEGTELESSREDGSLTYLHGSGFLAPGLEEALTGRTPGNRLRLTLGPDEAFGLRDENLVRRLPRAEFATLGDDLVQGLELEFEDDPDMDGARVVEILDEEVVVDANHPFAGMNLDFEVEVLEVRAATPEEIEQGYARGEDWEELDAEAEAEVEKENETPRT